MCGHAQCAELRSFIALLRLVTSCLPGTEATDTLLPVQSRYQTHQELLFNKHVMTALSFSVFLFFCHGGTLPVLSSCRVQKHLKSSTRCVRQSFAAFPPQCPGGNVPLACRMPLVQKSVRPWCREPAAAGESVGAQRADNWRAQAYRSSPGCYMHDLGHAFVPQTARSTAK